MATTTTTTMLVASHLSLLSRYRVPRNAAFWSPHHHHHHQKSKLNSWSISANSFDLSPPPIDHDFLVLGFLRKGSLKHFIMMMKRSMARRTELRGEDRTQFLHNQTTANFECLQPGQGCDTAFVTPTARTIDIAHAWIMKNAITLVVSPETCRTITEMLNK
ncbi:hypothetical protein Ahy_B03g062352 isoform C [Arachis hypogaea]|uniref:Uncharacterized protein n=1 Tax=Arachis hypogaea TaxID=3818 RepID=A0A444ZU02_ARAHY|nr:hypothetical protein Ahy_B03g062352 isoform C [Arachis hypogaea]